MYVVIFVWTNGYLPKPFFYVKSDTFMDFFNPLYWSERQDIYSEWKSVYTPFTFLILNIFPTLDIDASPKILREYNYLYLIVIYLGVFFSSTLILLKNIERQKFLIFSIVFMTLPFIYTLERGNLLFLAFVFLLLALRNDNKVFFFSIFLAMAISLKIFLAAILLIPLLSLQFTRVFLILFFTYFINEISAMILGLDNWWSFIDNMFSFTGNIKYYESSYFSLSYKNIFNSFSGYKPDYAELIFWLGLIIQLSVVLIFSIVCLKFLFMSAHNKSRNKDTLLLLLLMFAMISVKNIGGYASILLMPFVHIIIRNRITLYPFILIVLPIDFSILSINHLEINSFISDEMVLLTRDLSLGMILRPFIFLLLFIIISINFLMNSKSDHQNKRAAYA